MPIIHHYDVTPEDQAQLTNSTHQSDIEVRFSAEPLTVETADAEAVAVSIFLTSAITATVLEHLPNLKLIACRSTGFNHVDLQAAQVRGIAVVNTPTYGEHTVAEYTFGLLLALTRQLGAAQEAFDEGVASHETLRGTDLYGKTLGVVGTGHIGRNVAQIGVAFGMKVLVADLHPDEAWARQAGVTYAELDDVLPAVDVLSLHVPYSKAVHHLLNATRLKHLKPTAVVVNTARGELIDTAALLEALGNGALGGAALDVFEGESLVDVHNELAILRRRPGQSNLIRQGAQLDVLRRLPNVVATNHNAFNTTEAIGRINETTMSNIEQFLGGTVQNNVVRA